MSTVSVGATGQERTITHVAAGRITADSTDAVNGSQLYGTKTNKLMYCIAMYATWKKNPTAVMLVPQH